MVYDPCNPVPGTNIPSGLPPARPQHAVHHVVGRIRHRLHHKYVHAGGPAPAPPNPYGCEKHAVAPGAGRGALPNTPFPPSPIPKYAALGGVGLGAFGGFGGFVGGFPGGGGGGRVVVNKVPLTPPGTNPVIPVVTPPAVVTVPPIVPTTPNPPVVGPSPPGTPPVPVPEPASVVIFLMAILIALGTRYVLTRRMGMAPARAVFKLAGLPGVWGGRLRPPNLAFYLLPYLSQPDWYHRTARSPAARSATSR